MRSHTSDDGAVDEEELDEGGPGSGSGSSAAPLSLEEEEEEDAISGGVEFLRKRAPHFGACI